MKARDGGKECGLVRLPDGFQVWVLAGQSKLTLCASRQEME